MAAPDLATIVVIGVLAGLLTVALTHAQLVWLGRRRAADARPARGSSKLTWLAWACAAVAAVCVLRALASASLPDRQAYLVGEDLFSVRPRPGLVPRFETGSAVVRRGEPLLRFTGQDGEEATLAMKSRRAVLEGELEIERARPLEFDPEITRRAELARTTLHELEQRQKQLNSERDSIARELTQQRFAIASRVYRLEEDDRAAEHELAPLRTNRDAEQGALRSEESLVEKGYVSRVEAARERAALATLEGKLGQLEDRRELFARERADVAKLSSLSDTTYTQQLNARSAELARLATDLVGAREAVALAAATLEQDRPRALAQRDKRLHQIEVQIQECDVLLSGRESQLILAPFDGRIGFREPSPASAPADNGPLLVLYQPGKIGAAVRLESDEAGASDKDLSAELALPTAGPDRVEVSGEARPLPGAIARRTSLADGAAELFVAGDPPGRVARQLAMGGTVPVLVRLRRSVTSTTAFRAGAILAGLAVALAVAGALRRRFVRQETGAQRAAEPVASGAPWAGSVAIDAAALDRLAIVLAACGARGLLSPAGPPTTWSHTAALPEPARDGDEVGHLRELGARLRSQVEGGALALGLMRQVSEALSSGGYRAAALVAAGFGEIEEKQSIERAAFGLLASADRGALGEATRGCADFLRIMRAITPERMSDTLARLRSALIAAALDAAERGGTPSEAAATLVTPLVEA